MTESRIHKLKATAILHLIKEEKPGLLTLSYGCEKQPKTSQSLMKLLINN